MVYELVLFTLSTKPSVLAEVRPYRKQMFGARILECARTLCSHNLTDTIVMPSEIVARTICAV